MKLRFSLIADFANVTSDGKLNALGITDRLFASHFPAIHRELYVLNSLETEPEDDPEVMVQVYVINPDGRTIAEIEGRITLEPGRKQVINQVHCFRDLHFVSPGAHQVNLMLNGEVVCELQLELVQLEPER